MRTPRKIVIDTDPGVGIPGTDADDPIALYLAVNDPRLELIGVTTTFGNCPPELSARGAGAVLRALGREDIPISVGSPVPLSGTLPAQLVEAYEGVRGRPGRIPLPKADEVTTGLAAEDFLIEAVHAHAGEITIVAIGPQTNLARALQKDPSIAAALASVVFMGGGLGLDPEFGRGNVTPVAECNIYFDPEAADIVFRSGIPLTMVGLDVTNPNTGLLLTADAVAGIDRGTRDLAMFAEICDTYLESPMFQHGTGAVLYDPLAVAVAADPTIGGFERMSLSVETTGRFTRGETVPTPGENPNIDVMVRVDGPAVVRGIVDTITSRTAPAATTGANQ